MVAPVVAAAAAGPAVDLGKEVVRGVFDAMNTPAFGWEEVTVRHSKGGKTTTERKGGQVRLWEVGLGVFAVTTAYAVWAYTNPEAQKERKARQDEGDWLEHGSPLDRIGDWFAGKPV